jgi:acetyl esterase
VTLPLRIRLLGAALARAKGPVATMSDDKRRALRNPSAPRWLVAALNGAPAASTTSCDLTIPAPWGGLPARVHRPPGWTPASRLPVIVAFPGGGWVFGNAGSLDWLASHLATGLGAVVVAVTYRLAPEYPAPSAAEDCYAATQWVSQHAAELGADARRLAVLGESSGGNLAAAVALMARDRGDPPIRFQVLLYPATDLTLSSRSMTSNHDDPILPTADFRAYAGLYLGAQGDSRHPYISPLLAESHSGLPSAFILTADYDPLRDDGQRYAGALSKAGVPVEHLDLPDTPHGIFSFPHICRASPALAAVRRALHTALSA